MKKYLVILILIMSVVGVSANQPKSLKIETKAEEKPKLAIVIDDFGEDRRGVEEMLTIKCPLNIAVMPGLEFSEEDANKAHALGHEVLLHMPMENQSVMPDYYYGPLVIRNSFSANKAIETMAEALKTVPHAVGMNNHMGTGVTKNENLMRAILTEAKNRNMYFLDSKTIEGSVCERVANETETKFFSRNFFLEPPGYSNYNRACEELLKASDHAIKYGKAIAIGHVGAVGEDKTAKAIADTLQTIYNKGIEVVCLSKL